MSIVERALKKLQLQPAAAPSRVGPRLTPAGGAPAAVSRVAADVSSPRRVDTEPPTAVITRPILRIDKAALRVAGVLPPEHQARHIADQFRQIKRPLIANATGRNAAEVPNGHLIMIASALPGEGKTFTSINLAMSLALEKDLKVLLVDADVAKPHISAILGIGNEPGLLDSLQDESISPESLIMQTDIERLSVLPAGRRTETATELLSSDRMKQIVTRIAADGGNSIVLFDSPPLLLTSESRVLSSIVGQVALVVRAGFTAQQSVLDAISHIADDRVIGLVLNQCETEQDTYYYYGGYGAYGSGGSADEAAQ